MRRGCTFVGLAGAGHTPAPPGLTFYKRSFYQIRLFFSKEYTILCYNCLSSFDV